MNIFFMNEPFPKVTEFNIKKNYLLKFYSFKNFLKTIFLFLNELLVLLYIYIYIYLNLIIKPFEIIKVIKCKSLKDFKVFKD